MHLVVGLGNPGEEYAGTRHNVGFMVAEHFRRAQGLVRLRRRYGGRYCEGAAGGQHVAVLFPLTYMNRSGDAVAEAAAGKHISPKSITVVHDDLDFPLGVVRVRRGGGSGGHKGLESICASLGSAGFNRVRVGIGRPAAAPADVSDFVLSPFDKEETGLEAAVDKAVECVDAIIREGIEAAMDRCNQRRGRPE